MASTDIIDIRAMKSNLALGDDPASDWLSQIVENYLEHSKGLLRDLIDGLEHNDLESVRRRSHSLKLSSTYVGALRFAELCRKVGRHRSVAATGP